MTLHATFRKGQYCLTGTLEARTEDGRIGGPWPCSAGALRPINGFKVADEIKAELKALTEEYGEVTATVIREE